ncbi:MAG: YicC family protein [Reichenbachiella sp.]
MTRSMTGYGIARFENEQISITVEVKALNSKFLDIIAKVPKEVAPYEGELKKLVTTSLVRGKVNLNIELSYKSNSSQASKINPELFQLHKEQILKVTEGMKLSDADIFQSIMRISEIYISEDQQEDLLDPDVLKRLTQEALDKCVEFRVQEGKSVETALALFAKRINDNLEMIKVKDPERVVALKERLMEGLKELEANDKLDENRFEQELIFYIEKLDIMEEIVRLSNHLVYFHDTLSEQDSQGKKLGFISQEMGREINTIGSKANNADIQKHVVDMKDDLEKIKEQVLNIV